MEGREHMIRNEINILKRVSQGNKNILSLVDYFETVNNCRFFFIFSKWMMTIGIYKAL